MQTSREILLIDPLPLVPASSSTILSSLSEARSKPWLLGPVQSLSIEFWGMLLLNFSDCIGYCRTQGQFMKALWFSSVTAAVLFRSYIMMSSTNRSYILRLIVTLCNNMFDRILSLQVLSLPLIRSLIFSPSLIHQDISRIYVANLSYLLHCHLEFEGR